MTLTLVVTVLHCPFSPGTRCASSTVAPSEIVVMSAFSMPSSDVAAAARGRAARSSASAFVLSRAASDAEMFVFVESSK